MNFLTANPAYLRYWSAQLISGIGDAFRGMTTILWVYQLSDHNGLAIAALTAVQVLPTLVFGMYAGVIVDRLDRRRILMVADFLRVLTSLGMAYSALHASLWGGLTMLTLSTCVSVLASIAGSSAVVQLVRDSDRERANGLWSVMEQTSFIIGPLLATLSFNRWGPAPSFLIDAASFLISGLLMITLPRLPAPAAVAAQPSALRTLTEGLRYASASPLLRSSVLAQAARYVSSGINNTVMIFFITATLGRAAGDLAFMGAFNGVAQLLTGGLVIALATRASLTATLNWGSRLMVLGGLVIAFSTNLNMLIAGVIISSLGNAPVNIGQRTFDQRYIPLHLFGRTTGTQQTLLTLVFLGASTASGGLVNHVSPQLLLLASMAFLALNAVVVQFVVLPRATRAIPPQHAAPVT